MKFLILHLSDIHLDDKPFPTAKIQGIYDAINTIGDFNDMCVIVSGDLVQSGKQYQYDLFESFITSLINKFDLKQDMVFIVPGNHDIDFNSKACNRQFITNTLQNDDSKIKDFYDSNLENFYKFANNFYNAFRSNREVDKKFFTIADCSVQLQLINTSYGSIIDSSDTDKGLHFLSKNSLNEIASFNIPADIYITVMHHSPDFFRENDKVIIESKLIKSSNLLILGHEHYESNKSLNFEEDEIVIINGAALNLNGNEASKFNAIIINTNNHKVKTHTFTWDESRTEYQISNKPNERKMPICSGNTRQNVSFIKKIHVMEQFENFDIDDYYVFPPLQIHSDGAEKKEIKEIHHFDELIETKKTIIVEGGDFSGKTALSNYIYLRYKDSYTPVLFNETSVNNNKLKNIVHEAFKNQYNDDVYSWTKFVNDTDKKKIAIIDDAHIYKSDDLNILVSELSRHFDIFVLLTRTQWDYKLIDLIKERIENSAEKSVIRLRIQPLYYQKRIKLIENICNIYKNQSGKNINVKLMVKKLDKLISNELSIFHQNPGFTILFVLYALENNQFDTEKRIFNAAFESNISSIIQKNKDLDLITAMFILQMLAYEIHKTKKYPFPQSDFARIIEGFNNDGQGYRRNINPNEIISEIIKTKMLSFDKLTGGIVFVTESILAYFVAKGIINNKDETSIEKLISNSCFGINGLILLFYSYLSGDNKIAKSLLNELLELTSELPELSFDKKNINFLFEGISKKNIELSEKSYDEYKDSKDSVEQSMSNYQIQSVKLYEYNDNDFSEIDKITKTFKLIELLSRILPDFIYELAVDDIKRIVEILYAQPNKLLYWLFSQIDQNFEEFAKELTQLLSKNNALSEYSRIDWITNVINEVSVKTIFGLYHNTAKYASSINTMQALTKNPLKTNTNYAIQELFFIDAYEKADSANFSKDIFKIYRKTDVELIKRILEELLKHHVVSRDIKNYGEMQSIIDTMLNAHNSKAKHENQIFKVGRTKKPRNVDIRMKKK